MKKIAIATVLAGAAVSAAVGLASPANASPSQDARYVSCLARDGIYNSLGPSTTAQIGWDIATHISYGYRSPAAEQSWVYYNTPSGITRYDANVMVNCATSVWLGYGSDGTSYTSIA